MIREVKFFDLAKSSDSIKTYIQSFFYTNCATMLKDNKGTNIMKICPKCHHEFEDNVKFCKNCGTPLVEQLTCPHCGEPISKEDTFCGACGQQLQEKKEVPQTQTQLVKENKPADPSKVLKGLSIFVLSTLLLLTFLSFIGIFGEVLYRFDNMTGSGTTSIGLDFYSQMFSDSLQASKQGYQHFAAALYNLTTIQLLVYILAIIGIILGTALNIVFLVLVVKKNFNLKEKFLYIPFVLTLLHPLVFSFSYSGKMVVLGTNYQSISKLGWGTGMILVSAIIAICLLLAYSCLKRNILQHQKDGKITTGYVVLEALHLTLCMASVIIIMITAGHIFRIKYSETSGGTTLTVKGYGAAMSDYLGYLLNSESKGADFPKAAGLIGIGHSFLLFAFMGVLAYFVLMDNKKLAAPTIVGAVSIILLAIGVTLSYTGESGSISEASSGSMPPDAIKYSVLAIISYILVPVTLFMGLLKKTQLESMKSVA